LKAYYIVYILFTTGVQSVWAESSFTAERGGSVTIPCHYDQKYKHHVKYWCKGYHWSTCDVSINDDPDQLVFTVTMRNLQDKDSGTYWCAVEINGGSDDAVILPLIVRTGKLKFVPDVVFIVGGSVTIPCFYHQEYRGSVKYWCKGSKQTPMVRTDSSQRNDQVSISDDPAHLVFYVTMRNLEQEDTDIYWCAIKTNKEKDVFAVLDLKVLAAQWTKCLQNLYLL
uniref:Ig-like domain-containing protein n=1 Tax=Scleropages formosus TaxID=113540 RepID=A0A8C9TP14_SCLFO